MPKNNSVFVLTLVLAMILLFAAGIQILTCDIDRRVKSVASDLDTSAKRQEAMLQEIQALRERIELNKAQLCQAMYTGECNAE